jgi:hypothetical protein
VTSSEEKTSLAPVAQFFWEDFTQRTRRRRDHKSRIKSLIALKEKIKTFMDAQFEDAFNEIK